MSREPRIAFLARDLVWEDKSGGSLPFSYAARKLEASLRSAPDLAHVETAMFDLRTNDVDAFFERIRAFRPSVVAASTYIWSVQLFCQLAERIHRWDPEVRFVMGGPAARASVLALAPYAPYVPYIDAIVTGEAEEIIRCIAREHLRPDWKKTVPGLQVHSPFGWRKTAPMDRPVLDSYASPYQIGIVPHGGIGFLETFRGCPMSCAFCQWGVDQPDRVYSAEYLAAHLRGLDAAGVDRVYVLDAGFNLSPRAFRNLVQAEREVGVLKKWQVLGHIYPTFINDEHLQFFETFRRAEISVGVQSFDKEILKKLERPFDLARFEHVLGEMGSRFDVDLEIILGLPGDNPASFRRTFERAIATGTTVRVFYCLALPDALLERAGELAVDFDPETFWVRSCQGWSAESLRTEWEYVCQVASTMYRPNLGPNWVDFRPWSKASPQSDARSAMSSALGGDLVERLRQAVDRRDSGWRLSAARREGELLLLDLDGRFGRRLVLEVVEAREGRGSYVEREGIAYSHRGELAREETMPLRQLIEAVHENVRPMLPRL